MKTIVPIRNKQAVKEFIHFTNQVYHETGGNFSSIATNAKGMMDFMELMGYEGDIDELIKDMMMHYQKTPLFEGNGQTVGYCCTPAFTAIYKLQNEMIIVPVPLPDPIIVDQSPFH